MSLQSDYRQACDAYLAAFVKKHEFPMHDCSWVADEPGGIASIGDYFVNMQDIITDIDTDAHPDEWFAYYDYSMECHGFGLTCCNYQSWLKGCPTYSPETLERLRKLQRDVSDAEATLRKAIKEAEDADRNPFSSF